MEVKEAADLLDNLVGMVEDNNEADYDTALRMGIEALRASGDIIYRQAAIDALQKEINKGKPPFDDVMGSIRCGVRLARNIIEDLPSAQPTEASCWGCNCPKMERLKEQKTFSEMVHLHDAETHEERTETHGMCLDTISRQMAIDAFKKELTVGESKGNYVTLYSAVTYEGAKQILESLPSAQPEQQWIPFKTRPLTEEEQDKYPEWDCILDCKLPDDGQAILVSINLKGHERVQYDEFYTDDGSYLDSGYAIGAEATAWMPLPEPYKEGDNERA